MKVAIVSGHFMPELGYQEVYLARACARLGHEVCVFTSTTPSPAGNKVLAKAYPAGSSVDERYGFEVLRIPVLLGFGSNVIVRGLRDKVRAYQPDLIIIVAVAKLFAAPLLDARVARHSKMVAVFGDAAEYRDTTTISKRVRSAFQWLLFVSIKRRLYRRAAHYCDYIVFNHAETKGILRSQMDRDSLDELDRKGRVLTLGFDPDEFYYRGSDREVIRAKLGVGEDEILLITATRVNRKKNLEKLVELVASLRENGLKVHYLIIGFADDSYGRELKQFISRQREPGIFHCRPFLSHDRIREFYCAADIGIWLKAAISIQEAMGTGLQVVLEDKQVVSHLLESDDDGRYFRPNEISQVISALVGETAAMEGAQREQKRAARANRNRERLSYDVVAEKIIRLVAGQDA